MGRWGMLAAAVAAVIAGGLLSTTPADAAGTSARVVRWVDGDTVVTTRGTVRLIGVDTPERGRCGSVRATALAKRLAPKGSRIRLVDPASVQGTDRYGRLLRYVMRGQVDLGVRQIRAGSKARYDSKDGYDWHPRQDRYRRADRRNPDYRCSTAASGAYAPVPGTWRCPSYAPIKGNQGSPEWIYHMPWNAYYDATNPEACFATQAAAVAAGYRAARI